MPKLLISLPDGTQVPVDLVNGETFIGRDPENGIAIDDESLSGNHARFVVADGTCVLEDLGSTNGTFVNGEQIQSVQLSHGDQLQFGSLIAVFESEVAEVAETLDIEPAEPETEPLSQPVGSSRPGLRPAGFTSISPIKQAPSNNNSPVPLIAAGVIGLLAVGAAVYSILSIQIPG